MNLREESARLYIDGTALWAHLLPGWERARRILAGIESAPAEPAPRPAPVLLPPAERRRAPDTVAIAIAAGLEACAASGRDAMSLPAVFASTHGDLAITDYLCATLASNPALLSPTRFHNSVHNAAAGYWSIGTGCTRAYTAITAGAHSFGAGLLETCVQALAGKEAVLLVAYDIDARGPLSSMAPSQHMLSAGLVITPERSSHTVAEFKLRVGTTEHMHESRARPENAALVAGNAIESCLPFMESLAFSGTHDLVVFASPGAALYLQLQVQ
ncbi:MAG: beta-ketoacyl synthase chain length factor [Pseudomonadota bacterium]